MYDSRTPLKLGLVTGEYPPMEGGVGAFTQALAQALATAGHEVHILTGKQARPQQQQFNWRELDQPVDLGFAQLHPRVRHWKWSALSVLADIVLRYELDLVNIQYQAAAYHMRIPAINLLPWRLKGVAKTTVTFHDLRVPYLFPKAGRLRQAATHFMARQAHGVIATNPADYQSLTSMLPSGACIAQIPIGSNIPVHAGSPGVASDVREHLNLKPDDWLLGYFGFLNESKGADTLLESMAKLGSHVHLVFIGGQTGSSDPDNNQAFYDLIRQKVADLGLSERVHWTGFVSDSEVSAYLNAANLMVMPYRDGVSLRRGTLMAALAHGRPVITTEPSVPTGELNHGQNIYYVPVGDTAALAESISTVMEDPTLRERLGQGAFQLAGEFTWDKIAAKTARFFFEVMRTPD